MFFKEFILTVKVSHSGVKYYRRILSTQSSSFQLHETLKSKKVPVNAVSTSQESTVIPPIPRIQHISDILKISRTEAADIITKHPKLKSIILTDIKKRLQCYESNAVSLNTILQYPWLLIATVNEINDKINLLKKLPLDINHSVVLICQNKKYLFNVTYKALLFECTQLSINRIQIMANKLQCTADKVCFSIARYPFFIAISPSRVEETLDILLKYGISAENILNDFWIFKYKPSTIKERFDLGIAANLSVLKTWMVRCTLDNYSKTLSRHRANKIILGDLSSIHEYLSTRLNLEVKYAQTITDKYPEIKRMNVTKAKEVIDYLFMEGYNQSQIIRCPRILCSKLKTIQDRMNTLKSLGITDLPSLGHFCKSQQQFDQFLKQIIKNNTINIK